MGCWAFYLGLQVWGISHSLGFEELYKTLFRRVTTPVGFELLHSATYITGFWEGPTTGYDSWGLLAGFAYGFGRFYF